MSWTNPDSVMQVSGILISPECSGELSEIKTPELPTPIPQPRGQTQGHAPRTSSRAASLRDKGLLQGVLGVSGSKTPASGANPQEAAFAGLGDRGISAPRGLQDTLPLPQQF